MKRLVAPCLSALSPAALWPVLLALLLGGAGGGLFMALGMPLPWLTGALFFTTAGALAGRHIAVPRFLGTIMIAVLGVMTGGSFTPGTLERIPDWLGSIAIVLLFVSAAVAVTYAGLRRWTSFSPVTAYFSAAPGGFTSMSLIGHAMGGDLGTISLVQSMRIMVTVLCIPIWFTVTEGYQPESAAALLAPIRISLTDSGILVACAVSGMWVGRRLRLAAAPLLGPLLISIIVHSAGITEAGPPAPLVALAQVVLGANIGCRFAGVGVRRILRTLAIGGGSGFAILAAASLVALSVSRALDLPFADLLLAFAPGGFPNMVLISLAMGADTAFVTTHHVARMGFVLIVAPLVMRWLMGRASTYTKDQ